MLERQVVLKRQEVEDFLGKTITGYELLPNKGGITFSCSNGYEYMATHLPDCCEEVILEDISGNLDDLVGQPIIIAETTTKDNENDTSPMWTFYKFATPKGYVTLRWVGTTSGCHSELEVDFYRK